MPSTRGLARRRFGVLLSVSVAVAALVSAGSGTLSAAAASPVPAQQPVVVARAARVGLADPAGNDPTRVPYAEACYSSAAAAAGATCQQALVTDINAARHREHIRALVLPRGYARLTAAEQVFVVTNLERVDRGLAPVVGINAKLSVRALQGAAAGDDPTMVGWQLGPLHGQQWTSVQVTDSSALEADWLWMYSDGWGGSSTTNADCTSPRSAGCWGHRHNMLNTYGDLPILVTGTAGVSSEGRR